MKKRLLLLPAGGALLALLPVLGCAGDDVPAAKRSENPGDAAISKSVVELPLKDALKDSAPLPERPISFAASKGGVEMPIKNALKRSTPAPKAVSQPTFSLKSGVEVPIKDALKTSAPVALEKIKIRKNYAFSKMRVEEPLKAALKKAPAVVVKPTDPPLSTGIGKGMVEGPLLRGLGRDGRIVMVGNGTVFKVPANWPGGASPTSTPGLQDPGKSQVEAPVKRSLQQKKKEAVERPIKRALATGQSKRKVESPVKRALLPAPRIAARKTPQPRPGERVKAGLVTWHKSYEAALAASKRSGKPVMLLHTLGRLDDRFC